MPAKPRKIVSARGGLAIVNHCAIVNSLCVVNLLQRSISSTGGSFGNLLDCICFPVPIPDQRTLLATL